MKTKIKVEREDILFYGLIFAFTLLRVLTSKIYPCRTDFDCNSYIQMANTLAYDPHILPHHAMRILPSYLVHLLQEIGFTIPLAFRILSDSCYILFGGLTFWMLRQHQVKPMIAFAFTLLCLAPHHAMRQPLQDVYQLCDIMTYPLALLLIHFTLLKNGRWVFAISVLGLMTKQTLFGFGGLSLAYCFFHSKRYENVLYMGLLALGYLGLQTYYHAFSIVTNHLIPTDDFFTVSHLVEIFNQSKLVDLFVPLLPLLIIYSRQVFVFLYRHWHVAIYMAVVVGQPFIAFHLTGNNFQRLALQGVWILYLIVGLATVQKPWKKTLDYPLAIYTLAVYFTWGMSQRLTLMGIFTLICLLYYIVSFHRQEKLELTDSGSY